MVSLFRRFPGVMGVLSLALSAVFLYFSVNQMSLERDLTNAPEKLTLAEIRQRMTESPSKIWVEVLDGYVDCGSAEQWKATENFIFVTKYTTVLIANYDGTVVLRGSFKEWPACGEMRSQPLTGIVSRESASIATEVWEKDMNKIRDYPGAFVLSFCIHCTPSSLQETALVYLGLSAVMFFIFLVGIIKEVERYRKKSSVEP